MNTISSETYRAVTQEGILRLVGVFSLLLAVGSIISCTVPGPCYDTSDSPVCITASDGAGNSSSAIGGTSDPTAMVSESDSGALNEYCRDADLDGQGDPNVCIEAMGEPPPGYVPNNLDCDDNNVNTYTGAAENETPSAQCYRDIDNDGWGSNSPPDGVIPGSDCDDADASIFEICTDCTPNELFCKGSDSHLCNELGNDSALEEECQVGCNPEDGLCYKELMVYAGESVCINSGESVQLQAVASGGDGNYTWDWVPPDKLSDPTVENPMATPLVATTYTVSVEDGLDQVGSDNVSVSVTGALELSGEACQVAIFDFGGAPNVNWYWDPDLAELCQVANSTPTAQLCDWFLDNANFQGRFQVKSGDDDDYIGFLWGVQPFDPMTEFPKHFNFFSWKKGNQFGWCGGGFPQSGASGMIVKQIAVADPVNAPLSCADFHDIDDSTNATVLATPSDFTTEGWLGNVTYIFDLTHTSTGFTIRVLREDNMSVVAEKEFVNNIYPSGTIGFYTYSQENSCFSNFQTGCL